MTNNALHPVDDNNVNELANRAEELIDRRSMIASASRKLALPVLVTYMCSRDAMGMTGSGGVGATGDRRSAASGTSRRRRVRHTRRG